MKSPTEIVAKHPQLHLTSCVAWGLELTLKVHDRIGLNEFPFQGGPTPTGYGFGPTERAELERRGLKVGTHHDPHNLDPLERLIEKNLTEACVTIVMVPSMFYLNVETKKVELACHTFTADRENAELVFWTWDINSGRPIRLTRKEFADIYQIWRALAVCVPELEGSLINSLFASFAKEPSTSPSPNL